MPLPFGSQQHTSADLSNTDGRYLPIGDYGLIGNMRTCALVGKNGSIDWLCLPHFDSPSAFGALLDAEQGGRFTIAPSDAADGRGYAERQLYLPDTNVLITRFADDDSSVDLVDYMPVGSELDEDGHYRIIRRVTALRGTTRMRICCQPAFDYARDRHTVHLEEGGVVFRTKALKLGLTGPVSFETSEEGRAVAEFELKAGESLSFCLRVLQSIETEEGGSASEPLGAPLTDREERGLYEETVRFWRAWLSQSTYTGRWRESVHRSALALKLLTFQPTGAIVAAPTTSLPEIVGGTRNWDYRYTWIRDAAFTLYGLLRIGFTDEVTAFIGWLRERCEKCAEGETPLQIVYGIDGRRQLDESELEHLDGYRGSKPVRIGNGAADQLQLDIFGELLDAVYLYDKYGTPISHDFWQELRSYADWVCDNWNRTDEGIWEVRGEQQHFVYSKLMCWVALDRALRLADKRSLPAPRMRWLETRDAIYAEIMEKGYSEERGAFVQAYGSDHLDASNLLMPLVFFTGPNDPRMLSTLDATLASPEEGGLTYDALVYRYDTEHVDDGLGGQEEGAFNLCTFWLVEALARAGRTDPARLETAHTMFEKMLGYGNHLGLFSEETSPRGEALGNFPQAFSHLGLISAAFNLDRTLDGRDKPGRTPSNGQAPGAEPTSQPGVTGSARS